MDWSKTKSIFIIVFSILNIFLYSLYVRYTAESENVQVLVNDSVDDRLAGDNITFPSDLPETVGEEPYISGTRKELGADLIPGEDVRVNIVEDTRLLASFNDPPALEDGDDDKEILESFLEEHVYEGDEYVLWDIVEDENKAVFFQVINGKTLYYSDSGKVTLYWNENGEVTRYEQTIFDELVQNKQEKKLMPPKGAIETLYTKSVLQPNTEIDGVELGYSVYVPVSEDTLMFVPTWRVRATLEDGSKEEYFVNAVKDGVIELQQEEEELEETEIETAEEAGSE